MKITKRGEYALRTLLVLASNYEQGRTYSLHQIAEAENLPVKFLEQIMTILKRADFVKSSKGKNGGYILARSPKDISLGEIIRAVDGPLSPFLTAKEIEERLQQSSNHAGLYSAFLDVRNAVAKIMDKTTLSDVLEKSRTLSLAKQSEVMYEI